MGFFFRENKKQRNPERYEVPEELKLSFHDDLRSNPKEGVAETEGFDLRFICFFGQFKPKLKPKSSFSSIIFFSQDNKKRLCFVIKFSAFLLKERDREEMMNGQLRKTKKG